MAPRKKKFKPDDFEALSSKAAKMLGDDSGMLPEADDLEKVFAAKRAEAKSMSDSIASGSQKVTDAQTAIYKSMVAGLLSILPIAFEEYARFKTEGKAYGLSSIINQLKECMAILSGMENQGAKAAKISENIIEPAIMNMAAHMVTMSGPVKKAMDECGLKPAAAMALKKTVDKMCEQHALYLQGQIDMLTEQIHIEVTGEDPNVPQEKPAAGGAQKQKTPTAKRAASPRQQNQQKAAGKKKKPVKKSKGGDGNEKPPWED